MNDLGIRIELKGNTTENEEPSRIFHNSAQSRHDIATHGPQFIRLQDKSPPYLRPGEKYFSAPQKVQTTAQKRLDPVDTLINVRKLSEKQSGQSNLHLI